MLDDKAHRFAANYVPGADGTLTLADDPQDSRLRLPPRVPSGGGLVSTAADYARLCRFILCKGHLDGVRLLGRKTVELMTADHLTLQRVALHRHRLRPRLFG